MDDNELQVDEDLQEIYADSQRFELAMQPKIRDAEMRKHHALAGQAEERRRLENLQQQKDELEQQMAEVRNRLDAHTGDLAEADRRLEQPKTVSHKVYLEKRSVYDKIKKK